MSHSATSREGLARITPVSPPIVNSARSSSVGSIGVVIRTEPPDSVASDEKNFNTCRHSNNHRCRIEISSSIYIHTYGLHMVTPYKDSKKINTTQT